MHIANGTVQKWNSFVQLSIETVREIKNSNFCQFWVKIWPNFGQKLLPIVNELFETQNDSDDGHPLQDTVHISELTR